MPIPRWRPTREFTHWVLRTPLDRKREPEPLPAWLAALGWVVSAMAEYGLWILAGLLLAYLLWRLPHWLPWVRRQLREEAPLPELHEAAVPEAAPLPDDIPAAVSALWQQGRQRDALALLYRASVLRLADRLGSAFPPRRHRSRLPAARAAARRRRRAREFHRGGAHLAARGVRAAVPRCPGIRRPARGLVATLPGGAMKRQHLLLGALVLVLLAGIGMLLFPRLFKAGDGTTAAAAHRRGGLQPAVCAQAGPARARQKVSSWAEPRRG
jgi:hypothetical protein